MKRTNLFFVSCLTSCSVAFGQGPMTLGIKMEVESKKLHESREVLVYSPEKVPVPLPLIIVFDGEVLFGPTVSALRFMNYAQEVPLMPEAIVVGIENTYRNRDMPVPQSYGKEGEKNFSYFITEELIPKLKKEFPLNGQIVLIGHSQGGLFASYLMSQFASHFQFTLAIDAPMNVDAKVDFIKGGLSDLVNQQKNYRYFSAETAYGWGEKWDLFSQAPNAKRIQYLDESHESIPFKSIYDGLKFAFKGFTPPKKDMTLLALLHYYEGVSNQNAFSYEVPLQVLLASANRKIGDNRKTETIELLDFAEERYGVSDEIKKLRARASKLAEKPDPVVDFYLKHEKPTAVEIKPYLGRWVGELYVRNGQTLPMDFTISIENGKGKMMSVLPWPPFDKVETEILFVDKEGKLIFGRKNRGAGIVISETTLDKDSNLAGKEVLVGFTFPEGMPEDEKERMKIVLANPNTLKLSKR